jgi:hypothetical protein
MCNAYYLYGLVLYIFVVIYEIRIKDEKYVVFIVNERRGEKKMYKDRFICAMVKRYLMCFGKIDVYLMHKYQRLGEHIFEMFSHNSDVDMIHFSPFAIVNKSNASVLY